MKTKQKTNKKKKKRINSADADMMKSTCEACGRKLQLVCPNEWTMKDEDAFNQGAVFMLGITKGKLDDEERKLVKDKERVILEIEGDKASDIYKLYQKEGDDNCCDFFNKSKKDKWWENK